MACSSHITFSQHPNYLQIDSLKLYYETKGNGTPLLLLHGGTSTLETLSDYMDTLSLNYMVIAPEQQGHGHTNDITRDFDFEHMAKDMKTLLDTLGVDSVFILGWSDGGTLGLHLAVRYPKLVKKLVIVGSRYNPNGFTPEITDFIKNDFKNKHREKFLHLWFNTTMLNKSELELIKAKTLIISGDRDVIKLEHTIEMYETIEDAELFVVPNSDHFLLRKRKELVCPVIQKFFAPDLN